PEGLFWWSFYDRRSVDEFFEAALTYLSRKNEKLLDDVKSPNARARLISGMLYNGSYLFVLDGLEVMQKQEGDDYGEFGSDDLRQFLEYFSAPGHSSFCLITSRAPLFDLMDQTTFVHRDVTRLSEGEGCALLKKVGVMGSDSDLKRAVELWDGHAITLSLIGAYLAKDHGGDIAHLDDIDAPTADEQRYERVHRIMRRYDECLSDDERAFLLLFSAFRTPVEAAAFDKVFRTKTEKSALNAPIAALTHDEFKKLIDRLLNNRILRFDPIEAHYTTHPLIRAHYFALLSKGDDGQAQDTHRQIKDYYLSVAGDVPHHPTLDDLAPLIEVVHHACQAGAYDEAGWIYWERINQRDRGVLVLELGAYETDLATLKEFFHDHDICKEPRLSAPNHRGWILHELGFCLSSLGRLTEAALFYERGTPSGLDSRSVMNACKTHLNLTDLYLSLGQLTRGAKANASALDFAAQADDISGKRNALAYRGKVAHLRGDAKFAESSFRQAEVLERRDDGTASHLCSRRGIHHADHLRRIDRAG
ncbi:MAG: serine protease, partial [Deltaproteobacteria bacterium]|nr:serine protease [Deltaproteobacteria bacterium]